MRKKPNRLSALLMSVLLIMSALPTTAFAAGKIDTDHPASLTIQYKDGSTAISDAVFKIYKVADRDEYAGLTLTSVFEGYRNRISGLADLDHLSQEQWAALASTVKGYISKDRITPTAIGMTDSDGNLEIYGLEVGLYLVVGSRVTESNFYTYSAVPFMVLLPDTDSDRNEWNYDVTVIPKFAKDYNPPEDDDVFITRKVLKVWDDNGYETIRPAEVTVQLLRDGEVFDTQILNKDNNWRYAWDYLEADYEWEVIEKEAEGYAVSITRGGITFTVTNKYVVPIVGTNLPIQKRITGDKPETDSMFTFVFSAKDASCPMPAGSSGTVKEITITGAGSREIGAITFEKPGTYTYTISEKNGGVAGYTYDSTVYTVTFEVAEKDGELSVTKTIKDNKAGTVSAIEFTNPYKTPGNDLPQTGVLWWPVPLLLCAGLVFVMIGMIRRRRGN